MVISVVSTVVLVSSRIPRRSEAEVLVLVFLTALTMECCVDVESFEKLHRAIL